MKFGPYPVQANGDLVENVDDTSIATNSIRMGQLSSSVYDTSIRFDSVDVPKNADVLYAYIEFDLNTSENSSDGLDITFDIEDADDPAAPSSSADFTSRTLISPGIKFPPPVVGFDVVMGHEFTITSEGTTRVRTPNMFGYIDNIFARAGWNPGQAIQFFFKDSGSPDGSLITFDPSPKPTLTVVYGTSGNTHTRFKPDYKYNPNR